MSQKYDPNITYPNDAYSMRCEEIRVLEQKLAEANKKLEVLEKRIGKLEVALNTCKNDYWFMSNLIEKYGSNKEETLKDCLERMKFRKPLFEALGKITQ